MTSRAFRVVEMFEEAVAEFTGSRYGVAVDSCTTALFLSCLHERVGEVTIPARTYISVPNAIIHAGGTVRFIDTDWTGSYRLGGTRIVDSALRMRRGMYDDGLVCVSFHARKHIKIGRGGMVLTDDAEAAEWLRRMRFDGRHGAVPFLFDSDIAEQGYNAYLTPEQAARGLQLLEGHPDDAPDLTPVYPDLRTLPAFREVVAV
jgi:dTDP-4-amino-4,6-dideoxygalactose transaminase